MCYTIEINLTRGQLENRFGARMSDAGDYNPRRRVNAFSIPKIPVITTEEKEKIGMMHWGLVPSWVKDSSEAEEIRNKTFNARSETVFEKPAFRIPVQKRRCMVLTNGFYEWQAAGKQKIPYFISLKESTVFALAGIYDLWYDKDKNEILHSFSVLTTEANALMAKIHNTRKRMPVILHPSVEKNWLDDIPELSVSEFFRPFDEKLMVAEPVNRELFSKKNENSGDTFIQGSLF